MLATLAFLSDLWTSGWGSSYSPKGCGGLQRISRRLIDRKQVGRESQGLGTKLGAFVVPTISFQRIRSTVSSMSLHQAAVLAKLSDFAGPSGAAGCERAGPGRLDPPRRGHGASRGPRRTLLHPGDPEAVSARAGWHGRDHLPDLDTDRLALPPHPESQLGSWNPREASLQPAASFPSRSCSSKAARPPRCWPPLPEPAGSGGVSGKGHPPGNAPRPLALRGWCLRGRWSRPQLQRTQECC